MAEEEISEDSGYQTGVPPEFDGPEPMDESDVDAYVGHLLEDAIDYIDELADHAVHTQRTRRCGNGPTGH